MVSTFSRRSDASRASDRCRRDSPCPLGVSSVGKRPLVASTTSSRLPGRAASQRSMISSARPSAYTSALSTRIPPASVNRSSWLNDVAWSVSLPKVSVPSASADTAQPLLPSRRYSISPPLRRSSLPRIGSHPMIAHASSLSLPARPQVFRYEDWTADAERGVLACRYSLDGREFAERVTLAPGPRWHTEAARAAARLVFLLAGVSYYKTAAPPVIDLGKTALTDAELAFLREFYLQGLGEFAYRNELDLSALRIEAPRAEHTTPAEQARGGRALVPF